MDVTTPHFDYPLRYTMGRAQIVEQDSDDDVMNCTYLACLTQRGARLFVPTFGLTDRTFTLQPIDLYSMRAEIDSSEPRSRSVLTQQMLNDLVARVTAGVASVGT